MALQDEVSIRTERQILGKVGRQSSESVLLAGQQSTVRIRSRRLSSGEVDAVQRETSFKSLLLSRRLHFNVCSAIGRATFAVIGVAGDGVMAGLKASGIKLGLRSGARHFASAGCPGVSELVIIGIIAGGGEIYRLSGGDGLRSGSAAYGGRAIGLRFYGDISGCAGGSTLSIVNLDCSGACAGSDTGGV